MENFNYGEAFRAFPVLWNRNHVNYANRGVQQSIRIHVLNLINTQLELPISYADLNHHEEKKERRLRRERAEARTPPEPLIPPQQEVQQADDILQDLPERDPPISPQVDLPEIELPQAINIELVAEDPEPFNIPLDEEMAEIDALLLELGNDHNYAMAPIDEPEREL